MVDECFDSNRKLSPVFVCLFFIFFVLILHRLFILRKTPVQIINNEIYINPQMTKMSATSSEREHSWERMLRDAEGDEGRLKPGPLVRKGFVLLLSCSTFL